MNFVGNYKYLALNSNQNYRRVKSQQNHSKINFDYKLGLKEIKYQVNCKYD